MTIREIRSLTGMSRAAFAKEYGIPLRTVENWEWEKSSCPEYVARLLERVVKEDIEIKAAEAEK